MTETNYGENAIRQGIEDCNTIFKLHGIGVIRKIAKYSERGKDDYCLAKIQRAKELIASNQKR